VFGTVGYALAVTAAHLTSIASYTEQNQAWHNAEHAVFVLIGYLFFLPIVGTEPIRWRLSYPVRFVLLLFLMPIDTFTGVALGYASANSPGAPVGPRPGWAPSALSDLHSGGAVMWIAGDGIMFGLMMIVFLMWARNEHATVSGRSFFERARRENLAAMLASQRPAVSGRAATPPAGTAEASRLDNPAPSPSPAEGGTIDDDEHLAAYNEYLARLNRPQGQAS
jgi:putative copper resistance protein D